MDNLTKDSDSGINSHIFLLILDFIIDAKIKYLNDYSYYLKKLKYYKKSESALVKAR